MATLLTKLLLAPLCVALASLASRRWGPRVGGLVGGLPVVGGPILLVLALQHDRAFGAASAAAALAGMLPLTVFVLVYGRLAQRFAPLVCVLAGWTGFLLAVVALSGVHIPRGVALALVWLAFWAAGRALPDLGEVGEEAPSAPGWDIPVRMGAACALVLVLSTASSSLGAHVSGLLAPFPIITAILAGFTHGHAGVERVEPLLRGFLIGYFAYAAFNFTVAIALPGWPIGAAFGIALVATAAVQLAVVGALSASARRRTPQPQS